MFVSAQLTSLSDLEEQLQRRLPGDVVTLEIGAVRAIVRQADHPLPGERRCVARPLADVTVPLIDLPARRQRHRRRSRRAAPSSRSGATSRSRSARSAGPLPKSRSCGAQHSTARARVRATAAVGRPAAPRCMMRRTARTSQPPGALALLGRHWAATQARAVGIPHSVRPRRVTASSSSARSGVTAHMSTPTRSTCASGHRLGGRARLPVVHDGCCLLAVDDLVVVRLAGRIGSRSTATCAPCAQTRVCYPCSGNSTAGARSS